MDTDGLLADEQALADLPVRPSENDLTKHFALAIRKPEGSVSRRLGRPHEIGRDTVLADTERSTVAAPATPRRIARIGSLGRMVRTVPGGAP